MNKIKSWMLVKALEQGEKIRFRMNSGDTPAKYVYAQKCSVLHNGIKITGFGRLQWNAAEVLASVFNTPQNWELDP